MCFGKAFPILLCILGLLSSSLAQDPGWKGIIPLRSTRADVDRLLGKFAVKLDKSVYYVTPDEIAVIRYQDQPCDSVMGKFGFGWDVAKDTVSIIGVIPKNRLTKEQAGVTAQFKEEKRAAIFTYYTKGDQTVSVETMNGFVTSVNYHPGANNEDKRCKRVQDCCWDIFPTVDQFSDDIPKRDQLARIDFFLYNLRYKLLRGVVVVSGPSARSRHADIRNLKVSLEKLRKKRKIEPNRVLIVDGGYRAYRGVQLNEYPIASEVHRIYLFVDPDPSPAKKSNF